MKFTPLFEIVLQREGAVPTPISIDTIGLQTSSTDHAGKDALRRQRLLVRQRTDGLTVLTGLADDGMPFLPLTGIKLRFDLIPLDPLLGFAFDLSALFPLRIPTFSNAPSGLVLQLGERIDMLEPSTPTDLLASVEIGSITSDWIQTPPRFVVSLQPRQIRWVYYVVMHRSDRIPSIRDSVATRALEFEVTPLSAASNELAQDRVGQVLVVGSPDGKVYRLSSKRSPPMDGKAQVGLQLLLDDQCYICDLPPPHSDQVMNLPVLNSPPLDAAYRVIRL